MVSTCTPDRLGASCASTWFSPSVTAGTLADGSFCTTSTSPGWPRTKASPISGWWPTTMSVTLPSGTGFGPAVSVTGTWPRLAGVPNGSTGSIVMRWFGPSRKPPVPGVDPSR